MLVFILATFVSPKKLPDRRGLFGGNAFKNPARYRNVKTLMSFYHNKLSFYILGQLLCKDFKIQVLPAAFYLNENVNFKQSAASGKMSTQGCCC